MIRALDNLCDLSQFPDLTKAGKIINRIYLSWNNLFKLVSSRQLQEMSSSEINWIKRFGMWIELKLYSA